MQRLLSCARCNAHTQRKQDHKEAKKGPHGSIFGKYGILGPQGVLTPCASPRPAYMRSTHVIYERCEFSNVACYSLFVVGFHHTR